MMYLDSSLSKALADTRIRELQREAAQNSGLWNRGRQSAQSFRKILLPSWVGIHAHDS
jgi:hypothetical protein